MLLSFLCMIMCLIGCEKSGNPVADYLENAELQYEGKIQEENIRTALNDILNLTEEQLKSKRYKDYAGKEDQWDLPTLIYKHFVPDRKGKTLGNNFYRDVKAEEVQKKIIDMLKPMKIIIEPSKYLREVVSMVQSIDFYPEEEDSIFYSMDPEKHWLHIPEGMGSKEIGSAFMGVREIWCVNLKKKSPVFFESQKYFPDICIEEWHFRSEGETKRSLTSLDNFRKLDCSEKATLFLKAPVIWWQDGEKIYILHTRAEMFRSHLLKIAKIMQDMQYD